MRSAPGKQRVARPDTDSAITFGVNVQSLLGEGVPLPEILGTLNEFLTAHEDPSVPVANQYLWDWRGRLAE